jgi:uncharacterized repeat protein (TIGR03803 family)
MKIILIKICLLVMVLIMMSTASRGQSVVPIYSFTNGPSPTQLTKGADGNFYCACVEGPLNGIFKLSTNGLISRLGLIPSGLTPNALTLGPDGNFYGTTAYVDILNPGTVFQVTKTGGYKTIYAFGSNTVQFVSQDGSNPNSLTVGPDGNLYGTTTSGGIYWGTVFKITTNGILTTLYSFTNGNDGGSPNALTLGSDGNFYGTEGGGQDYVFKVTTGGILTSLGEVPYNLAGFGSSPTPALTLGSDGNLYGTVPQQQNADESYNYGIVFQVTTNGGLTTIYSFTGGNDGANPFSPMTLGSDGNLYGLTDGTVFRLSTNGTLTTICDASINQDVNALVLGNDGTLYGSTASTEFLSGTVFKVTTNGDFTTIYTCNNAPRQGGETCGPEGASPKAALVKGPDGNFYGTTPYGGYGSGNGTIFRVTPNGVLTTLYYFGSTTNTDGANPNELTLGPDGNFYGTTYEGGINNNGTIFKVTTNGNFTTLYSFTAIDINNSTNSDGANPNGLTLGPDGTFYGTTVNGGQHSYGYNSTSFGTVFSFTTNGVLTSLYSFNGANDGSAPEALAAGLDGNFYGTTYLGEISGNSLVSNGTIFRMQTNGNLTTIFAFPIVQTNLDGSIVYNQDGEHPNPLTLGPDGNFYGTTSCYGESSPPFGTVFKVSFNGDFTLLYTFTNTVNGASPSYGGFPSYMRLALGPRGVFYGTTGIGGIVGFGGSGGYGTVFQVTTNGIFTPLYDFTGVNDGAYPYAGMALGTDGNFYGTTSGGRNGGIGGIYRFVPFTDTNQPTISITTPTANQTLSNFVFSVTGAASDNVAVSKVWVQLNSGGWNPVTSFTSGNWTEQVTLTMPGTNTVRAYAVDTSGNDSTTNQVSFIYLPSAMLTVQLTGKGTLTPDYSNAVLAIGTDYSMTAAVVAGSGFAFANWSGGTALPLVILTNGLTLKFVMQSNLVLQASFVDTNRPALSITNVAAGLNVSNADFTVKGTAGDNAAVSNVFYLLNNGGWSNAVTGNNWSNWSDAVALVPGTNTIAAYAADTSGNVSTTNSASLFFVVTNQLEVQATGLGTISPNYSNAWLDIGRNYSITSAPAGGFIFTNWTVSTNWLGDAIVVSKILQFTMESNLTLQANFLETNRPRLTITAPMAGQHMTNALAAVVGTTTDSWKVSAVWYQLTNGILPGGTWNLITGTTNNYTNWTAAITLATGTNTVKAYAEDLGGNFSPTNSVSFVSSNTFKLQLNFAVQPLASNGLNYALQISPGLNGRVQVSTDLLDWLTLTNFVGGTNNAINLLDQEATNFNHRFYRAVVP